MMLAWLVTSPRLRGEVGSRTSGCRVRGELLPHLRAPCSREQAPHPGPLPAGGARRYSAHALRQCLRTFAAVSNLLLALGCAIPTAAQPSAGTTLRFVPHADLAILDPYFTGTYITRN